MHAHSPFKGLVSGTISNRACLCIAINTAFDDDWTVGTVIYIWLHFAFQELKKKDAKLKTVSDEYEERYPHSSWLFLLCKLIVAF